MKREKIENGEGFKVYVDQLKNGHVETIKETFASDFLDIHEKELVFSDPVEVNGEAYATEGNLILHLEISTFATMPCSICNQPVKVPIRVQNLYHTEPVAEIKSGIFSMMNVIREGILIDTPSFAECDNGHCPARKEVAKYFKKPTSDADKDDHGYRPFEDLKLD